MNEPITTPRLRLRPMALSDLDFLAELLADPEVMRYYPHWYSRDEARAWIERQLHRYATAGHGLWLVEDRRTRAPIGQVGPVLRVVDGAEEVEVGYLIHRPYWRRGYATEAAQACVDYAFRDLNRPRVIALIRPANLPSQGVARKLGMHCDRHTIFMEHAHLVFMRARP